MSTGEALFPGDVVHVPPQAGGAEDTSPANPLKLDGPDPWLSELSLNHCELQNVTPDPIPALRSPMTKTPRSGKAKTIASCVSADVR